jgi:hypothetical protein
MLQILNNIKKLSKEDAAQIIYQALKDSKGKEPDFKSITYALINDNSFGYIWNNKGLIDCQAVWKKDYNLKSICQGEIFSPSFAYYIEYPICFAKIDKRVPWKVENTFKGNHMLLRRYGTENFRFFIDDKPLNLSPKNILFILFIPKKGITKVCIKLKNNTLYELSLEDFGEITSLLYMSTKLGLKSSNLQKIHESNAVFTTPLIFSSGGHRSKSYKQAHELMQKHYDSTNEKLNNVV